MTLAPATIPPEPYIIHDRKFVVQFLTKNQFFLCPPLKHRRKSPS